MDEGSPTIGENTAQHFNLIDCPTPEKIQTGPRALLIFIDTLDAVPENRLSQYLFVRFKPDLSDPAQKPYGSKSSSIVKHRNDLKWDDHLTVCIGNEKSPSPLTFEALYWRRFHDPGLLGEASISREEMSILMKQNIGFHYTLVLPLHDKEGRKIQVIGQENPCCLVLHVKVISDTNKSLLSYHPEVNINLQVEVEHLLETLSIKKSMLTYWRMAFLGMLSGVWMTIAACFAFSIAGV